MARPGALPTMDLAEFSTKVYRPEEPARPPSGEEGEGAEAPEPAQPPAPAETYLILFDRGTEDDRRLARVLAQAAAQHADRVRAYRIPVEALSEHIARWERERRAYDSYTFRFWPVVGVFRRGRFLTTFHPRLVFYDRRLQEREEAEQLEIFLSKLVYYDPAQVKVQKNLELEAGI
jgi:hypothetical protein